MRSLGVSTDPHAKNLLPFLLLSKGYPPEKSHGRTILFRYGDRVVGYRFPQVLLACFGSKHITLKHWSDVLNRAMDGYGMPPTRIAGKGKGAIGQRKGDTSMCDPKSVEHFGTNGHAQGAGALTYGYEFRAQPFAERVVVVHFMENI